MAGEALNTRVPPQLKVPKFGTDERQNRYELETCLREIASRIYAIERHIYEQSGNNFSTGRAAEEGIQVGHYIWRNDQSGACWLARADDLTRFATDYVFMVIGKTVYSRPVANEATVRVTASDTAATAQPTIFLSVHPGLATFNGAEEGALFRQPVGRATGTRESDGTCKAFVLCGYPQEIVQE